jgi:hypothetical protein
VSVRATAVTTRFLDPLIELGPVTTRPSHGRVPETAESAQTTANRRRASATRIDVSIPNGTIRKPNP